MDIVEFLTARYDEREAAATACPGPRWYDSTGEGIYPADDPRHSGMILTGPYGGIPEEVERHVLLNDPAYLLDDIAAKRKILDDYTAGFERRRQHPGDVASAADLLAMHRTVKRLAQPFAAHPDFDPAWTAR